MTDHPISKAHRLVELEKLYLEQLSVFHKELDKLYAYRKNNLRSKESRDCFTRCDIGESILRDRYFEFISLNSEVHLEIIRSSKKSSHVK